MQNTMLALFISEAKPKVAEAGTIEEKLKAAMTLAADHWMITQQDDRFKVAVGAVMDHYGEGSDEFKRLAWEMKSLSKLGVMLDAAKLGMGLDVESLETMANDRPYEPLGLMKMWLETSKASAGFASECDGDDW